MAYESSIEMTTKLYFNYLILSTVLVLTFAQENKILDNIDSEVEIITGKEPTGKMLMPFHRSYSYPLIVQPVNVCKYHPTKYSAQLQNILK